MRFSFILSTAPINFRTICDYSATLSYIFTVQRYKTSARFFIFTRHFSLLFSIFAFVMKQKEHHVIISLASNENQEANLEAARVQLTQLLTSVRFTSAIWTEPVNAQSSMFNGQCSMVNGQCRKYLNQLCEGTTTFGEGLLCEVLKEAEKRQGRTHNEDGIVTLDLDLLEYDGVRHHLRDWERSYVKDLIGEL